MKKFCKKLLVFTLLTIFIFWGLFLMIKYDYEMHFSNKLEKEHKDYMKYHTTVEEKINYHGFKFEEHKIKTEDGYILTVIRIPGRLGEKIFQNHKKRAVMITHGLLDASYTFLAHGENESLPFILASAGYDVWLTNNRGSSFSREHVDPSKDANDPGSEFWDFSLDEMVKYDLIAKINYIKKTSGNEKISYVCHSQGCIQFYLGYTLNPGFFEKSIDKFGSMGAVLSYKNVNKLIPAILKKFQILEWLEHYKFKNIMSFHHDHIKAFGYLCHRALWICRNVISSIVSDQDTNNIDWAALHNMYYYQPGGSSVRNIQHWLQILGAEKIRHFDFGKEKNIEIYGAVEPPVYDFEKIKNMTIDIFFTSTTGDPYCLKEEYDLMLKTFHNAKITKVDLDNYHHLDYLWSKKAHEDIYKHLLVFLNDV